MGVLQRGLEEAGLATVSISLVREHTEKIRPPRAVVVPFPFGMAVGAPGDAEQQHRVLAAALDTFTAPAGPVLVDLSGDERTPAGIRGAPVQASEIVSRATDADVATEVFVMRRHHETWVEREGRTAVGLSGIAPRRFRGVVRALEAFAEGRDPELRERPADVAAPLFLRYCVDDLKAMYLEARMVTHPAEDPDATARWLWAETALGVLLRAVRDRLLAAEDPAVRELAHGVAR